MPGVGVITAEEVFSERVELQPRTSDPSGTEEGEGWIRSDIAPESNQIATLRVDTGGSTIDVPILQAGTATDGVVEALRLSVGGTLGYVPAIPESKAAFPALRLQHNGQVYGWHDARGETAFFDVAITATNSPIADGETLTVDYSVQNTGGSINDTQDIRLDVGSSERDRDSGVTIASGGSTTGQLSWGSAVEGSYTASVLTDDDVASTSVSVGFAIPDSIVSRPADDATITGASDEVGLEVSLNSDWPSIAARISANTTGATRAYLRDSNQNLVADTDISGKSAGDTFKFESVDLPSGNNYLITLDREGSTYDYGYDDDFGGYPVTGEDLDIVGTIAAGNQSTANPRGVNDIGNPDGVL